MEHILSAKIRKQSLKCWRPSSQGETGSIFFWQADGNQFLPLSVFRFLQQNLLAMVAGTSSSMQPGVSLVHLPNFIRAVLFYRFR